MKKARQKQENKAYAELFAIKRRIGACRGD